MLTKELIDAASSVGIEFPTELPLYDNPPNEENLKAWINCQLTPVLRGFALKIAENLEYISFNSFMQQLRITISDFNQKIADASYIIIIAEDRSDKLRGGCSDTWVLGLVLEYINIKPPNAIIFIKDACDYLTKHKDINNILILDDAAYSGSQKRGFLHDYFNGRYKKQISPQYKERLSEINLYLGFGYCTEFAAKVLLKTANNFKSITLLNYHVMRSVLQCFNQDEVTYAKKYSIGYLDARHSLTYFDHRIADFESFFQTISDGNALFIPAPNIMKYFGYTFEVEYAKTDIDLTLITTPEEYNKLAIKLLQPDYGKVSGGLNIPYVIAPYKYTNLEDRDNITKAIKRKKIGTRNANQTKNEAVNSITTTTNHCLDSLPTTYFDKPEINIKQQIYLDVVIYLEILDLKQISFLNMEKRINSFKEHIALNSSASETGVDVRIKQMYTFHCSIQNLYNTLNKLSLVGAKVNDNPLIDFHKSISRCSIKALNNNQDRIRARLLLFKENTKQAVITYKEHVEVDKFKLRFFNFAIFLTGVGALALLVKLIYSILMNKKTSLFFEKDLSHMARIEEFNKQVASLECINYDSTTAKP
jgi:hypothetical protein